MTYEILNERVGSADKAIRCLLCGTVSARPVDVIQKYCARCDRFHSDAIRLASTAFSTGIRDLRPDMDPAAATLALARVLELLAPANFPPRIAQPQWSDPAFAMPVKETNA